MSPNRGALFVLCGALFLDALDVSMKGVALPAIGADIGVSPGSLQWVVGAYTLGFGGFLLLGGRVADLLGRRRVFIASLAAFVVASTLAGLADGSAQLVFARFLTGVGAAFTAPVGLSIITTSFAEGSSRNRALAVYSATGASGFAFGLVAGGALTQIQWRWVFFLPVILAAVIAVAAVRLIPGAPRTRTAGGLDVPGALTATTALLLLVTALARAPQSYGPLTMAATAGIDGREQGVAGGLVNTPFQIGPALALAAVAAVIDTKIQLLSGLKTALLVPFVATLIGMAFTAAGLRINTAIPASSPEGAPHGA
jgi:MFS family permease